MTFRTRRLAATVAAALMLVAPVACSSDDDDATDTTTITEAPTPGTDDGGGDAAHGDDTEPEPGGDTGNDDPATTAGSGGGDQGPSPQPGTVEAFCAAIEETDSSEVNTPEGLAAVLRDIHEVAPSEVADALGELIDIVASAETVDDLDGHARGMELNDVMADYTDTHCDS